MGNFLSALVGAANPAAVIGTIASAAGPILGYVGQKETNAANSAEAERQRVFNASEAEKQRNWQEEMRGTQYQTTVDDLSKAGLNPMLAYSQGGAGTPNGATASQSSLPQMGNKAQAALTATATAAQIANVLAQTEKTEADTDVSRAVATKTQAETNLVTNSATNVAQNTENLKAALEQIKQNVQLQKEQTSSEITKRVLQRSQADLNDVIRMVEEKKISQAEAQTRLLQITAKLSELQVPKAANEAGAQKTWWMKNVSPFLNDIGKTINSTGGAINILRGN